MFAVTFDDFKRRAERENPDMEIKALCTAYTNSPDFQAYWNLHEGGTNPNLHLSMEVDPPNLGTFYIIREKKDEVEDMTEQAPVRDISQPTWEVVKTTIDNENVKQYLVKLGRAHNIRVLSHVDASGKVKPPIFGETEYCLVTQRSEPFDANGEQRVYHETTAHAADADGEFYNACIYSVTKSAELWEVMYAIGEI